MNNIESIITDLEHQRSAIDQAISALRSVTGTPESSSAIASEQKELLTKKRGISAAGRKRLADAMRRRWAAKRASQDKTVQESGSGRDKGAATRKHRLSPEGRKRIIEATKRRWALKRAAEQSAGKARHYRDA